MDTAEIKILAKQIKLLAQEINNSVKSGDYGNAILNSNQIKEKASEIDKICND